MDSPVVVVAIIGGVFSVIVASLGLVGTWLGTRRRPTEPSAASGGADPVVKALAAEIDRLQTTLVKAERRATACEAREALRRTESEARGDR